MIELKNISLKKILLILFGVGLVAAIVVGIATFLYWRSLITTPQYSLASLVSAAKTGDDTAVNRFIDTNALVENFVPQVTRKAAELYGRGIPDATLSQLTTVAAPLMPSIKTRVKTELPGLIRRETERFGDIPFAAMVVGADKYMDITVNAEIATLRSKLSEHNFEIKMSRNGDIWQVIGIRDDELATRIARTIGDQIIGAATGRIAESAGKNLGVKNLENLLLEVEKLLE